MSQQTLMKLFHGNYKLKKKKFKYGNEQIVQQFTLLISFIR